MHTSVRLNTPCEFINVTPVNPLISKVQIKVCYVSDEPNRNKSVITKETARKIANTLPGNPIVGYYNKETKDFEEHNRIIEIEDGNFKMADGTRPYGFVDLGAKVWFQKFLDDGQNEREYLMTEGYLWTGQYPEAQRVITQGNNQSMELDPNNIDAHWTKDSNGKYKFFVINEAIISKLCILGEDYEPCFEGASISKFQFSFDDGFKEELFKMISEVKDLLKGGTQISMNDETKILEEGQDENTQFNASENEVNTEDQIEENAGESAGQASEGEATGDGSAEGQTEDNGEVTAEGNPAAEPTVPAYTLEEIPEYVSLQTDFSNLQTKYAELETNYNTLNTEVAQLRSFKFSVERVEKENMIKSFYMLSDEDKADIVNNIDSYSLDEIEAKLSVICVRNKVNFAALEEENKEPMQNLTFNLGAAVIEDNSNTPAWVKAVLDTAKTLK